MEAATTRWTEFAEDAKASNGKGYFVKKPEKAVIFCVSLQ